VMMIDLGKGDGASSYRARCDCIVGLPLATIL